MSEPIELDPAPPVPLRVAARQAAAAAQAALVERFRVLPERDRALVEFLALSTHPIAPDALLSALVLVLERSAAVEVVEAVRNRLREFVGRRADALVALGGEPLRDAAVESLIASGRNRRYAERSGTLHARAGTHFDSQHDYPIVLRLRLAALLGGADPETFSGLLRRYHGGDPYGLAAELLSEVLTLERLDAVHPRVGAPLLARWLGHALVAPSAQAPALLAAALRMARNGLEYATYVVPPLIEHAILSDLPAIAPLVDPALPGFRDTSMAWDAVRNGADPESVLPTFDRGLKHLREGLGPKVVVFGVAGMTWLSILVHAEAPAMRKRCAQIAALKLTPHVELGGTAFGAWQQFARSRATGAPWVEPVLPPLCRPDDVFWVALFARWSGQAPSAALAARLRAAREQARIADWRWLATQIDSLDDAQQAAVANPPLVRWFNARPAWQSALSALADLARAPIAVPTKASAGGSRLYATLRVDAPVAGHAWLQVFEQRAKGNEWQPGRAITSALSLRKLPERMADADEADARLVAALVHDFARDGVGWVAADNRILAALIGHPRVFSADAKKQPLVVQRGEPELKATRRAQGMIALALEPPEAAAGEALLQQVGDSIRVIRPDARLRKLIEVVGQGIELPAEALPTLLDAMPGLARIARIGGDLFGTAETERNASMQLHALLRPLGDGLRLRLVVRPLGAGSAPQTPGVGPDTIVGVDAGVPVRARRELGAERRALLAMQDRCPLLAALDADGQLDVADPESALELLEALQALEPDLALEWPEGRALRVGRARQATDLGLRIGSQRDWFGAEGGLSLQDGSVVALAEVLKALAASQGRYLRLDAERVVALSETLRKRLVLLRGFADASGKVQIPRVAAFALRDALDDSAEVDDAFARQVARMDAAQALQPRMPAALQAELRDYQEDGVRFLLRLAAWDAGACLADDMGLGKTIQALAVLVARAGNGPALVIAPTSVVPNWLAEANRFAPTLNVRVYGGADRVAMLDALARGDLLLASYGLLTQDIERFAKVEFATVVLDEAQAIKNPATQRAQAVRALQAQFRIATTGTPIENHLGELWSLFRVLNPGLLGSEERFRERFAGPIERDPRSPQRDVLRRLIAPFVLRRTKAEVLSELPPRTEIVQLIEPNEGEARLLAAMRRQALDHLGDASVPPEQRRFRVLAELTRLRRAACHPDLVAPELKLASAKLDHLVELVRELTDNHHRALVFSQFTDHLALVRTRFEAEGISYQYLDGQTTPKRRQAAIDAFQGGEGDVFLLSLKAGGVGLNLTAADYVVHLDPWWNPAVEQQASDRAHRIGQTRPVTIYKLVLAGSIEERVLSLHASKRELIGSVLDGASSAAPIDAESLLALIAD
jgi:superfamily II DNA or RNA helicase